MHKRSLVLLVALIVTANNTVSLDSALGQQKNIASNSEIKPESLSWDWTREVWTGDDARFVKIRQEIETAFAQKRLTLSLLRKNEAAAKSSPQSATAQFRWGYTILQAPYAGIDLGNNEWSAYTPIVRALAIPASPHSYQYARLRFVLMTLRTPMRELGAVGKRLLKRDSQDYSIKFYTVNYLSGSPLKVDRDLALAYAQEMVHSDPKRSSAYSSLGRVYEDRFFQHGDFSAADKAIAAYQRCYELSPREKSKDRSAALRLIELIKQEKARQQHEGFKPLTVAGS